MVDCSTTNGFCWIGIMPKRPYSTQDRNPEDLRRKVQQWLIELGYSITPDTQPGALWILVGEATGGPPLVVVNPAKAADAVLINGIVEIPLDVRALISVLPTDQRAEMLWDIRFAVLSAALDFEGLDDGTARVVIRAPIYSDAMTKDAFMQRLLLVRNSTLSVIWRMQKAISAAAPGPGLGFNLGGPLN